MHPPSVSKLILHFESREDWRRSIAKGVLEHVRKTTNWEPVLITEPDALRRLLNAPGETEDWVGVIGAFFVQEEDCVRRCLALGLPVVNVTSWRPPRGVDWIHADDRGIGETAARYFIDRGYRQFAYLGQRGWPTSSVRLEGFQTALREKNLSPARVYDQDQHPAHFTAWLKALPLPCAVMVCNDLHAQFLFEHIEASGLTVPDHLAVLGVDDDDLLCILSKIPLSSIRPDWEQVGRRAAMALDLRVAQRKPAGGPTTEVISACKVVMRQSTDAFAVEDDLVQKTLAVIRNDLRSPPSVQHLAARLGVSPRTLSRHVRRTLGKSVKQVILHARLEQAYDLVVNNNHSIGEIAWLTGFNKQSRFNAAFRERFKHAPTQLRHRRKQAPPRPT
ncbi:MAG: substrate-binding domain-containing protein [Verrucomicrobia bacterium]|nr:substrate-binding domain-containing protein [Verrucomicrobiota bacterium]MCH8527978.1 substrate-binding domain-containing protein [Kiritimatiellia bacterium]